MDHIQFEAGGLCVKLPGEALKPLIRLIVAETQAAIASDDRLAYGESEAAKLLDVPRHVLRDARLRGEIRAVKLGKSWRYSRANLLRHLDGSTAA